MTTTVLVATAGGHLTQLAELAPRLPFGLTDRVWVTFDTPQSRSLLAGEDVVYVDPIQPRQLGRAVREMPDARRLLRQRRADTVVSTGAALAVSYLIPAAAMRIPAHYVESSARVEGPSTTGRILERVPGIRLYRQYEHAASGRWRYAGSVFAGFSARPAANPMRPIRRVVVTLGTVEESFRRLVERLIEILPAGADVLWQTGLTPVDGLPIDAADFVPAADLQAAMATADVVVAHSGCGSVLDALSAGRCPVIVPRRLARGECVDDHQSQIARWIAARDLAVHAELGDLTADHLRQAAGRCVVRVAHPPLLELAS